MYSPHTQKIRVESWGPTQNWSLTKKIYYLKHDSVQTLGVT